MLFKKPSFKYELDISKFKDEGKLGEGAYGLVHKVQEKETNDNFALKYINLKESEEKNIWREIEIMIGANHPTITKCYGYFTKNFNNEDQLSILIQYEDNGSLDKILELIKQGKIPKNYTNTTRQIILVGIARGMKYLHDRNIVHRDLKPGNVLIDELFQPHISDFGMSKNFEQGHDYTQSQYGGTPIYMAPEIATEDNFDGKKIDVYAFSILMYEVVTDLTPYPAIKTKGIHRILYLINNENYRPKFNNNIKNSIQKLIEKCWSHNPKERPNFKEIFNKLSGITDGEKYLLEGVNKEELNKYVKSITKIDDPIEHLLQENEKLENEIENLPKSVFLETTVSMFNSLPLKMQQIVIADLLSYLSDEEIFLFFIKINNILLYLLNFKQLETEKCFEIILKENNGELCLIQMTKEFPIKILYDASEILFNNKGIDSPEFFNSIKDFEKILIELRYPSVNFDSNYELAFNTIKPKYKKSQIYFGVFITGMTETDKKFKGDKNINFVRLDKCITKITGGTFTGSSFDNCKSLIEIKIPSSVTSIGEHSFIGSALFEIEIPSSVTEIDVGVLRYCKYLKKAILTPSIKKIPAFFFEGCTSLKEFVIPSSVEEIDFDAFRGCTSLERIVIPPSVKSIGRCAFWDCKSLHNVTIPSSVTYIGNYAFPDETIKSKE